MSEQPAEPQGIEWRRLYPDEGRAGRETIFVRGIARGDYYAARGTEDVFRVRFWMRYRVQGGDEQFVLGQERARQVLTDLAERALATEGGE
jgi:hypothetical protein